MPWSEVRIPVLVQIFLLRAYKENYIKTEVSECRAITAVSNGTWYFIANNPPVKVTKITTISKYKGKQNKGVEKMAHYFNGSRKFTNINNVSL